MHLSFGQGRNIVKHITSADPENSVRLCVCVCVCGGGSDIVFFLFLLSSTFFTERNNAIYTTLSNLNTKYLVICKVYTDVGGVKQPVINTCGVQPKEVANLFMTSQLDDVGKQHEKAIVRSPDLLS